jgi:hypothetical protein
MQVHICAICASLNARIERGVVIQMIEFLASKWTIGLICICIGLIFGLIASDWKHADGVIHVNKDGNKYLFEFNIAPERIPLMKQVIFTVKLEDDEQNLQVP